MKGGGEGYEGMREGVGVAIGKRFCRNAGELAGGGEGEHRIE